MKQVWKCDFCYDANGDQDVMAVHEATCQFNPAMKTCMSCKNQTEHAWSQFAHSCAVGIGAEELFDIQDGDKQCDKWEQRIK